MITEYTEKYAPTVISWHPKHNSSVFNATITDGRDRSRCDPKITEYTAQDAPAVATLNKNANNSLFQCNRQSTNMNYNYTVESCSDTELLCKRVTLLVKVLANNNSRNAMRKILQYVLVQIQ